MKDEDLAAAATQIAAMANLKPDESREMIRAAIERDYIVVPGKPLPVPGAG